MNTSIFLKALAIILIILTNSCSKEDNLTETSNGSLEFSFAASNYQTSTANFKCKDEPSAIYISIKDSEQAYVYNLHKFPLIKIGEEYITQEIELAVGNYTIEDFIVVNSEDSVMYLTPKEGSELADLVENPLPVSFSISEDLITAVVLEVLPSDLGNASEFGYVTISFNIANTLDKGLIAFYPLDDNANDYSQFSNHGTVHGAIPVLDRQNNQNSAYYLDGIDDYISFTKNNYGIDSTLSISLWMKTSSINKQWIIGKYDWTEEAGFHLYTMDGIPRFNGRDRNEEYIRCIAENPINDNQWHHIVALVDNSKWSLWVDNYKVTETDSGHIAIDISCSQPLEIGRFLLGEYGDHHYYNGYIDDVKIYDRVLTVQEINWLYNLD